MSVSATKTPLPGSVAAVIVTYNPDLVFLRQLVAGLRTQVAAILIVDNASSNQTQLIEFEQVDSCELIKNTDNLGLGTAHNQGIHRAADMGCDYALLLDQDSSPDESMVNELRSAHQSLSQTHLLAAVGATYRNLANGSQSFFVRFGWLKFKRAYCSDCSTVIQADFLISSGSLFALSVFDEVGYMDESLFIDHVDTEWFLRARAKGYQTFGVCSAQMEHDLGQKTHRLKLGRRERNVPQHNAFRYYYIFRNSMTLYLRRNISWLWKWNDLQRLIQIVFMFGVLKAPRRQNLRMMWLGMCDGVRGRAGQNKALHQHDSGATDVE